MNNIELFKSPSLRFCQAAAKAFPNIGNLDHIDPATPLSDLWQLISQKAHTNGHGLAAGLARVLDCKVALNLEDVNVSLLEKLPEKTAASLLVLPLLETEQGIIVASANPLDDETNERIRFAMGRNCIYEIASAEDIELAIANAYSRTGTEGTQSLGKLLWDDSGTPIDIGNSEEEIPRFARELLLKAISMRASDLHLQPFASSAVVRIRVDGVLHRLTLLPEAISAELVRYFKANGGMDPTNHLVAQDGRMSLQVGNHDYDLRLSVLPVGGGQRLVIRFLDQSRIFRLNDVGFSLATTQAMRRLSKSSSGVILLTGPTGSGKTTTLYSLLGEVNVVGINIITVEDPVEYRLTGISQVEVNPKSGLTFASALRSILRQDPEVILIGEIRDEETAKIAMQSALTGHLVFSTLHTNDALTSIARLVDLGISPSILADALAAVVSQRLLRKLCSNCKEPVTEPLSQDEALFAAVSKVKPAYRPKGCEHCSYSGYSGRIPITEIVEITPGLITCIASGKTDEASLLAACGEEFQNIANVASRRIISGDTTAIEAARVIGRHFWFDIASANNKPVPDLSQLELTSNLERDKTAVLLIGEELVADEKLGESLKQAWLRIYSAGSAIEARKILEDHDAIRYVVVDLPENLNDEEIVKYIDDYRVAMAWSRLPALLLLPESKSHWEALLIEAGATSRFVRKPCSSDTLIHWISGV